MKHVWDIDYCPKKLPEQMNVFELRDYVKRLEEKLKDKDETIRAIIDGNRRPHGEWISCSERLPEESGQYYVSGGDKVWICSFLIIPTCKGGWCNNVSNPVVEAWMPLPEPYEEEGDEK